MKSQQYFTSSHQKMELISLPHKYGRLCDVLIMWEFSDQDSRDLAVSTLAALGLIWLQSKQAKTSLLGDGRQNGERSQSCQPSLSRHIIDYPAPGTLQIQKPR